MGCGMNKSIRNEKKKVTQENEIQEVKLKLRFKFLKMLKISTLRPIQEVSSHLEISYYQDSKP